MSRLIANKQFDHDADAFHQSLCIDDNIRFLARELILFTSFDNAIQRKLLYEDVHQDAPQELKTMSGDLQYCLRMISDPLLYEFTLLVFIKTHHIAIEMIGYWQLVNMSSEDKEISKKVKLLELLEQLKSQNEDSNTQLIDDLSKPNLLKRIDMVIKSRSSFNTYLNMLNAWAGTNIVFQKCDKPEVDAILDNLFSDNHE